MCVWDAGVTGVELKQAFEQDLLVMRFHPSGLYVLIARANELTLMGIYLDAHDASVRLEAIQSLKVEHCIICEFCNCIDTNKFAFVDGMNLKFHSVVGFTQLATIRTQEFGQIMQIKLIIYCFNLQLFLYTLIIF